VYTHSSQAGIRLQSVHTYDKKHTAPTASHWGPPAKPHSPCLPSLLTTLLPWPLLQVSVSSFSPQQVQIGAMQVDLGTLVWERRVAMQNVPLGAVQIHLSGKDMGNFVSHPLFQQAASTAVQVSGTLATCYCAAATAAAGCQC
jgi:hypothetical protein